MLSGPLLPRMLLFALPLIASGVLQQSFNSVDVAIVGRFTGSHALAAVGSTGPVIGILINFFIGISVGVNVLVAQFIGQHNAQGVRRAVCASALLSLICGALMLVIGESFASPVLRLTGTPEAVLDDAVLYMRIFVLGLPFMVIYNFGAAVLNSVGDTRRPFYSLVVGGVINVGLNFLFVVGMDMGVAGVAWGTALSNIVSAAIVVVLLIRERSDIRLDIKALRLEISEMRKIVNLGVPAGLQRAIFAFSNIFILSAINSFGAAATAGSASAVNYEFYCYFPLSAIGQTAIAFVSQNYGAGNHDRIRRIFRLSLIMGFVMTFALNMVLAWKSEFFLRVFTTDPDVLVYAGIRMHTVMMFQFLATYYEIAGCTMRGLGHSMTPTVIVILGTCVLRLIWVGLFPYFGGDFADLLMVYPITWIVTDVFMAVAYRRVRRKALAPIMS